MTQWISDVPEGRARGPRGLAAAWVAALVRPRRFFREGVAPGDQAPGLVFAVAVTFVAATTRLALVPAARPSFGGSPELASVLAVALVAGVAAPAALHLVAALQTLALLPLVDDRGGVSETVQTVAYATAPCVFAGVPYAPLQVVCGAYGAVLLVVGTSEVHGTSLRRAALVAALPAALVFGYGYGAFAAAGALAGGG